MASPDFEIHICETSLDSTLLAHELGHAMGLRGDYPATGKCKDGVMAYLSEGGHGDPIHVSQTKKVRE